MPEKIKILGWINNNCEWCGDTGKMVNIELKGMSRLICKDCLKIYFNIDMKQKKQFFKSGVD